MPDDATEAYERGVQIIRLQSFIACIRDAGSLGEAQHIARAALEAVPAPYPHKELPKC